MIEFSISSDEMVKINEFVQRKTRELADLQGATDGIPKLGAIGGGLSFTFTPTSLGTVLQVTWCRGTPMEETLDATDYSLW